MALPQVELSTTLADVTRIPLNNAHDKSLANWQKTDDILRLYSVPDASVFTDAQSVVIFFTKTPTYLPFLIPCLLSLTSRPSSSVPPRINIAKVNIEGIGAPSPLPHCAFLSGYVWHAIARPGWRATALEPWWRQLACPLCECLNWLYQEVICILHCCC